VGFNTFLETWVKRPIAGLPLRMIFLCEWHRMHAGLIFAGVAIAGVGDWRHVFRVKLIGLAVALPSVVCLALWVGLTPLFLLLDKLFPSPRRDG
jgi:hypothetical protein